MPSHHDVIYHYTSQDGLLGIIRSAEIWATDILYLNDANDALDSDGGHFCVFAKTIFEYIEDTYGVNFLTAGGQIDHNIWDDPVALGLFTPMNEISIIATGTSGACTLGFATSGSNSIFLPYNDLRDKSEKTLYDWVMAFFNHLHIIKDDIELNGENVIALRRFDDLSNTDINIVNWSGKMSGVPTFKPYIDGYAQHNWIRFKSVHKSLNTSFGEIDIPCLNQNLDVNLDLFQIDAYIPTLETIRVTVVPETFDYIYDMSESESFKTFTFFLKGEQTAYDCSIGYLKESININGLIPLYKPALYDVNSEYLLLKSAMQYPKFYEIKKWLKASDIRNFEFFKLY